MFLFAGNAEDSTPVFHSFQVQRGTPGIDLFNKIEAFFDRIKWIGMEKRAGIYGPSLGESSNHMQPKERVPFHR